MELMNAFASAAVLAALTLSLSASAKPTSKKVVLAGVPWESSLDAAKPRAKKEGKPILHLQMFGRLDDSFC
jgi:hypothetical protein